MELIIIIVLLFFFLEFFLLFLINYLKKNFQWLITEKDEYPEFSKKKIDNFFKNSFDKNLGWIRKKNTSGTEHSKNSISKFNIDKQGARFNKFNINPRVAIFGDSYAFCRQVNDHQAWPALLSGQLKFGFLNFGVGNYGLDQALLRYEKTKLSKKVKIVIVGVVPETISRIHSYWKHYLEFGNILAFKPMFKLKNDTLILKKPIIQSPKDFKKIKQIIKAAKKDDYFYNRKFKKYKLSFPYTFSFLKNLERNSKIFIYLILNKISFLLKNSNSFFDLAYYEIMKKNILESHSLYSEKTCNKLLKTIIYRFKSKCKERGHYPLLLIMPQLLDLKLKNNKVLEYEKFFNELKKEMDILDLTSIIYKKNFESLYIEDKYGGHFSPKGNKVVYKIVLDHLKNRI